MDRREKRLQWHEWLELAELYAKQNGNLLVKRDYQTPDGEKLGRWVERQRAAYKGKGSYMMTDDRIVALEAIGMQWHLEIRAKWDTYFGHAQKYYACHKNLLIPSSYKTSNGLHLGEWIKQQRKKYKNGKLSPAQIKRLVSIDMQWSLVRRPTWDDWVAMATHYHNINGDINPPANYKTKEGYALGIWISSQRSRYKTRRNTFREEEIKSLENIGIVWDTYEASWLKMYELAERYYKANANLDVPQKYITPTGEKLGQWIGVQRQTHSGHTHSSLSKERIELLNKIGMKW